MRSKILLPFCLVGIALVLRLRDLSDVSFWFGKTIKGKTIKNADDLADFFLEEIYVSTVSGSAFGMDNCLRISYAASIDQLEDAMNRIKNVLTEN